MAGAAGAPGSDRMRGSALDLSPAPAGRLARPLLPSIERSVRALGGRPLTLATGAAAALPVLVSSVRAVRVGWEPTDDKAIIATRAYDVLTRHTPLVGQYSMAGRVTGHPAHDLGPMLYWLLAVPVRLGAPAAVAVTMGAVNTAAVVAVVALARSRGGRALMFMTAVAVALMCRSLAAETFHDIWNPAAALFPFLLLIFLCWSLACGRHRLLPLTVLVASFVVQAHLSYLAPTAGLVAIGLAGVVATRRRELVAVGLLSLAVAAACWVPAGVDQATEHPGNLTSVVATATAQRATLGARVGAHAVVRAVGFRPWWLVVPGTRWDRKHDVRATPSATRVDTAIAVLAALALVGAVGLVRRRIDLAAAALIGFALCAGLFAVAAETPRQPVLAATLGYTLWWGSQAGTWVWLLLAWSAWLAAGALIARHVSSGKHRLRAAGLASVAGLAVAALAGSAVAAGEEPDQHVALYRPIAAIGERLDTAIRPGTVVRLDGRLDVRTQPFKAAVRFELAGRGIRVLSRGAAARNGDWYELDHRRYDVILTLTDRPRRPRGEHASLLIHERFVELGARHAVFVWMAHR